MSKRFGRNQRRRAREALASAQVEVHRWQYAHDMARGLAHDLNVKLEEARATIAEAKEIAGEMSALFPVVETHAPWPREVAERGAMFLTGYPKRHAPPNHVFDTWQQVALPVLLARVDFNALREQVHAKLVFPDGSSGYAISRSALQTLSEKQLRERVLRVVAPDLVRHLVVQLKGSRP